MSEDELAQVLVDLGYLELFQRGDLAELDRLWSAPDAPASLTALALNPARPAPARFLAAEVLYERDPDWPPADQLTVLGELYAMALRRNLTTMANPWGLPGGPAGPVGAHVRGLGSAALPAFAGLLDDPTGLSYGGSKEATFGNSYQYRVRDVAAELIADILAVAYPIHQSPADRDAEVDQLRQRIAARGAGDG